MNRALPICLLLVIVLALTAMGASYLMGRQSENAARLGELGLGE